MTRRPQMDPTLAHELSQFLDGRLPSGRKELLLDRIDADPEAARLLVEMEAAQELARSLPSLRTGSGFTEALWERIRSGEGTPEAVFRDPVSPWVKARYVGSGALAAAAALFAFRLLQPVDPGAPPAPVVAAVDGQVEAPDEVAAHPAAQGAAGSGRLRQKVPDHAYRPTAHLSLASIVPETVAHAGQLECVDALATLQSRVAGLEPRLGEHQPEEVVVELRPAVARMRVATELMRFLQSEQFVELPAEFDTTLTLAERAVRHLHTAGSGGDPGQLRVAVQDLRDLEVDRLRERFSVICCRSLEEFRALLSERILRDPQFARALRFLPVRGAGQAFAARGLPAIELPGLPLMFQLEAAPLDNIVIEIRSR